MFVIIGFHRIKQARWDDYVREVAVHAANSRAEPGCVRYEVYRDTADPAVFCLYEAFEDEAAALVHQASPHHERWMGLSKDWRDGPPVARWETASVSIAGPGEDFGGHAAGAFVIIGLRRVLPEFQDDYAEHIAQMATLSRAEPGCIRYEVLRDNADPAVFARYECFADEAAARAHQHAPHHGAWFALTNGWYDGERVGRWELTSVSLG
jgi:autoinducer 2-degrading protein